jgi:general secretion pathway protein B
MSADGEPAARNYNPLIWAAGSAGVLVVAGVVIVLFGPWHAAPVPEGRSTDSSDERVALAAASERAPVPRDDAPAQLAQGEQPPQQPGAIDPGARPVEPPMGRATPPPAYPPVTSPRHAVAPARVATLERRAETRPPAPAAALAQAPVEHYGAPAPARGNAITNINDLPPNVRAQLPRLNVGGAIYSETPSARMVILNGQVFHEGEKPAADTVLEQIRLKSAVLNFRGQRYEVSF